MEYFTGMEYLKIDIGNHFGLDKKQFEERIDWVDSNESSLEMLEDQAKTPYRYPASVMAYRKAQQGIPTGYTVGCDASASGVQMLSALMGCKIGAANAGLTGNKRVDFYAKTHRTMDDFLGMHMDYTPKVVKDASMTSYYGSVAEPKKAFGEGTPALEAFYKAQLKMAPGAVNLLNISKQITEPFVKYYKTTLPDGFTAKIRVYDTKDTRIQIGELDDISIKYRHKVNSGKEKDVSLAAHIAHMTDGFVNREMCGRCNYDNNILSPAKHLIDLCKPNAKEFNYDKANRIEQLWHDHSYTSITGIDHISPLNIRSFSREYLDDLSVLVDDILDRPSFHMLSNHKSLWF